MIAIDFDVVGQEWYENTDKEGIKTENVYLQIARVAWKRKILTMNDLKKVDVFQRYF